MHNIFLPIAFNRYSNAFPLFHVISGRISRICGAYDSFSNIKQGEWNESIVIGLTNGFDLAALREMKGRISLYHIVDLLGQSYPILRNPNKILVRIISTLTKMNVKGLSRWNLTFSFTHRK